MKNLKINKQTPTQIKENFCKYESTSYSETGFYSTDGCLMFVDKEKKVVRFVCDNHTAEKLDERKTYYLTWIEGVALVLALVAASVLILILKG